MVEGRITENQSMKVKEWEKPSSGGYFEGGGNQRCGPFLTVGSAEAGSLVTQSRKQKGELSVFF